MSLAMCVCAIVSVTGYKQNFLSNLDNKERERATSFLSLIYLLFTKRHEHASHTGCNQFDTYNLRNVRDERAHVHIGALTLVRICENVCGIQCRRNYTLAFSAGTRTLRQTFLNEDLSAMGTN